MQISRIALFLCLAPLASCKTLDVLISASDCLNTSLVECQGSSNARDVSRPADVYVYQMEQPVDVARISFNELVVAANEPADVFEHEPLSVHFTTIEPGDSDLLTLSKKEDARYLVTFFAGRQGDGDQDWLVQKRIRPWTRELVVGLEMFQIFYWSEQGR